MRAHSGRISSSSRYRIYCVAQIPSIDEYSDSEFPPAIAHSPFFPNDTVGSTEMAVLGTLYRPFIFG